jgi:hypothetical protein
MGIISNFISLIEPITLIINFICLFIVFIGGLYIAIHARNIPIWFRTPLWYVGLSSFLICVSIICEWTIGPSLFLSYSNFGIFGETLLNINLAICSGLMFVKTMYNDIRCIKLRKDSHRDIKIK